MLNELNALAKNINDQKNLKIYAELKLLVETDMVKELVVTAISRGYDRAFVFYKEYDNKIQYEHLFATPVNNSILTKLKEKYPEPEFRITYGIDPRVVSLDILEYYKICIHWGTVRDDCRCTIF